MYSEGTEKYAVVSWGSSCAVTSTGYLLTANHVVTGGERYIVGGWADTNKTVQADVVRRDEKNDLAVIKVKPPNEIPAWVSGQFAETSEVSEGMDVFMWGYLAVPGGFIQFLRRGIVSNNTPVVPTDKMVYVETTASFGTSGSPAYLQSGKPLGIVSSAVTLPGGFPLPAGEAGVIPGENINRLLRDVGILPSTQASASRPIN